MCVVSMVMGQGLSWPPEYWKQPIVPVIFEDIYKAAKKYDEVNNEPNCELEEKKAAIRRLADSLNIKINFE